jgi:hypothetical protein
LDENNSYIYISDIFNNRIQWFSLLGGSPNNGTTVAGGNGLGSSNKQLNNPHSAHVSKKTKAIYVRYLELEVILLYKVFMQHIFII